MRTRIAALAALLLLAGCGHAPPPDPATSRAMVARAVLDWHRFQGEANGEAGCPLLTEKVQAAMVEQSRKTARIAGTPPPETCVEAVAGYPKGARFRALMRNTQVDAVRIASRTIRHMLELRPSCECCDRDLPPDSPDARICTYECTFCADCVETRLGGVCPNCGGNFERRPIRPAAALERDPASTVRVFEPAGCAGA
jgi:uncharacterized protein